MEVRKFNIIRNKETLISHSSVKKVEESWNRENHMLAMRKQTGESSYNRNETLSMVEELHGELIHSDAQPQTEEQRSEKRLQQRKTKLKLY